MASAQKKVVVRMLSGELVRGYLPQAGFASAGVLEVMSAEGKPIPCNLSWIATIAYVRDWNLDDPADPERLGRRSFAARPRVFGLWLRLGLLGGNEALEGLADFDLSALQAMLADGGLFITPPDTRGNTLRLFIPGTALRSVEVLGWIAPPKARVAPARARANLTGNLFAPPGDRPAGE